MDAGRGGSSDHWEQITYTYDPSGRWIAGEEAFHLGGGAEGVAATRGPPRVRREVVCGKAAIILHSAGLRGCVAGADMV